MCASVVKDSDPAASNTGVTDRARVFFALWPEHPVCTDILVVCRQLPENQGRPVAPDNLHITLCFIGEVDRRQLHLFAEAAEDVRAEATTLVLDRLGYFARSRILWLGCTRTPAPLQDMVASLNNALSKRGYRPERRPFQAHVTLLRNAKPLRQLPRFPPVDWRINGFVLVESLLRPTGARYRIIKEYCCAG